MNIRDDFDIFYVDNFHFFKTISVTTCYLIFVNAQQFNAYSIVFYNRKKVLNNFVNQNENTGSQDSIL